MTYGSGWFWQAAGFYLQKSFPLSTWLAIGNKNWVFDLVASKRSFSAG